MRLQMKINKKQDLVYSKITSMISETLDGIKSSVNEASGPSGQEWESLISVGLAQINRKKIESLPEWKIAQKYWSDETIKNQAIKLATEFKKWFSVTQLSQLGDKRAQLSPSWKKWGGTNNTPKTDLLGGNYHISLKKVGGSQLISGLAGEIQATFNAAKESMGANESLKGETIKWIDGLGAKMVKLSYKGYVEDLDKLESEYDWEELSPKQQDWITQKNFLRESNKELTKELNNFFQDEKFKKAFCFEAVTGNKKFQSRDAVANQLVEFDPKNGSITKAISVRKHNDVGQIANSTKFYFSFKTSSGQASVALRTAQIKSKYSNFMESKLAIPTLSEIIMSEYSSLNESIRKTVEGMISENSIPLNEFSVIDAIKSLGNKASEVAPKLKNIIVNFFSKISEKIKSTIELIKNLGKQMIDGLLQFLGIEVEVEDVEGEVNNWW